MHNRSLLAVLLAAAVAAPLLFATPAQAWGEEGHRFINRVAAEHLPDDVPPFLKAATARLAFLGPEPDRWRDSRELYKALSEVNGPDHFIDIDKPENFSALPNDRYQYAAWLRAQGKEPKDVGFGVHDDFHKFFADGNDRNAVHFHHRFERGNGFGFR